MIERHRCERAVKKLMTGGRSDLLGKFLGVGDVERDKLQWEKEARGSLKSCKRRTGSLTRNENLQELQRTEKLFCDVLVLGNGTDEKSGADG